MNFHLKKESTDSNIMDYMDQLLSQGQDSLNICPDCFANKKRKYCCENMVVLDNVLVCCYLGDKHEISKAKFKKKMRELKKST